MSFDFTAELEMPEPHGPCIVSWGDPEVSSFDLDWIVERQRVSAGLRLWESMATRETFLWHELTQLAREAGRSLIVWRKEV